MSGSEISNVGASSSVVREPHEVHVDDVSLSELDEDARKFQLPRNKESHIDYASSIDYAGSSIYID